MNLKKEKNGLDAEPPVELFVMGERAIRTS
jgi:hypothetical protein